jgi:hypothetical protein
MRTFDLFLCSDNNAYPSDCSRQELTGLTGSTSTEAQKTVAARPAGTDCKESPGGRSGSDGLESKKRIVKPLKGGSRNYSNSNINNM